ncbi:MAG: hypothetical protein Q9186_005506 [Xanthomendoza sp. 1 TL-2023]
MHLTTLSFTLASFIFFTVVSSTAVKHEEKRQAGCNRDNAFRALQAQASEAFSLCPSLILFVPTTTVTVPAAGVTPAPVYPFINNQQRLNTDFISLSNAYDCCNSCLNNPVCVAYFNVPGVSCNTLTTNPNFADSCQAFFSLSRVFVSPARFPNNLGGKGPCGSSSDITVVRT